MKKKKPNKFSERHCIAAPKEDNFYVRLTPVFERLLRLAPDTKVDFTYSLNEEDKSVILDLDVEPAIDLPKEDLNHYISRAYPFVRIFVDSNKHANKCAICNTYAGHEPDCDVLEAELWLLRMEDLLNGNTT